MKKMIDICSCWFMLCLIPTAVTVLTLSVDMSSRSKVTLKPRGYRSESVYTPKALNTFYNVSRSENKVAPAFQTEIEPQ